ncbi:TIGR01777 family oxidoreductase [Mucilaginibacter sp. PAMB04168]|uniref:TIGR01777 family oxidoreductase n=1 Tax=Mucilaginibacter sp. PAMB04168 TaxID=3138567 RepID=UPI0031F61241
MQHVLITGGTGLIGNPLTEALLAKGYQVSHLSRSPGKNPNVKTYLWDVAKGQIDPSCINGVDTVIHLAGAGIADKRWTADRKKQLIESRTQSIQLIYGLLKQNTNHQVRHIISASATGYYSNRGNEWLTENSVPLHDFLSTCCIEWEKAVDEGLELGLTITKFRTGVVLTTKGGALPQLAKPVRHALGAPLGSGKQYIPWIHIQDAVDIYLQAIEGSLTPDTYNMVAPNPVTNQQLTEAVAKEFNKPLWLPNVPAAVLKLIFGEMSIVVLGSTRVSAQKVQDAGYQFKYNNIDNALRDIYA